ERIGDEDRVLAFRAGGQHRHRRTDQLFNVTDIFDRLRRKIIPRTRTGGRFRPARQRFIDRLHARLRAHGGRQIVDALAVKFIGDADLDFVETIQNIKLCQRDSGDAGGTNRLANDHGIEPAAATLATRYHAKFMTLGAEELTDFVVEFGRERTFANARRIGLGNAEYIANSCRTKARTGSSLTGNRVGGCHERIGAVVVVEQCALRAFEQDAVARLAAFVENAPDLIDIGQDLVGNRGQLGQNGFDRDFLKAHAAAQQIVVGEQALNLRLKRFRLGHIDDADGATANLVFIGRANAALGRADLEARIGAFAHGIEIAVDGEDERGIFGNAQYVRIDVDALRAQFLDFGNEMMWIDNDAV